MDYNTFIATMSSVRDFYQDSFSSLLWFSGISLGLIGILTPIIINWITTRSFENKFQKIKNELSVLYNEELTKNKLLIEKQNETISKIKKKHDILYNVYLATLSDLYIETKNYYMAFQYEKDVISNYIKRNDFRYLNSIAILKLQRIFDNIKPDDLSDIKDEAYALYDIINKTSFDNLKHKYKKILKKKYAL